MNILPVATGITAATAATATNTNTNTNNDYQLIYIPNDTDIVSGRVDVWTCGRIEPIIIYK